MPLYDYFLFATLGLALLVVCVLAFLQIRKKPVALWIWFVPGTLILLYGMFAMMSSLTELDKFLVPWGNSYMLDGLERMRTDAPLTTGIGSLVFAISAVIASFGGRVQSWRAAGQVGVAATVGTLAVTGWMFAQLASHETSLAAIMDVFVIGNGLIFWSLAFVLVLAACARGAAAQLSREHAVVLAGLAGCTGFMIVLGCLAPVAHEQFFQIPNSLHWQASRDTLQTVIDILLPAGLLAFVVILVCTVLMLRQSTAWVARPKRLNVAILLALCVMVLGLIGLNAVMFQNTTAKLTKAVVHENLGVLPYSTDEYIVPASTSQIGSEDRGVAIIVGRESLRATPFNTFYGWESDPTDAPTIAFTRGEALPEELGKKLHKMIEEQKRQSVMTRRDYDPVVHLAADQLTDYQTIYALIAHSYEQELSQPKLLIRRGNGAGTQAGVINAIYLTDSDDARESYNRSPHLHISQNGFSVRTPEAATLPAQTGCPSNGPTVCTSVPPEKLNATLQKARELFLQGQNDQAQKLADEYLAGFDFRSLYNQMATLKKVMPEETVVIISADPNVSYNVIVRAIDTLRFSLENDQYDSDEAFEKAGVREENNRYSTLFADPVFSAPRP